jgi:isoleucyl-tRNA synthetase
VDESLIDEGLMERMDLAVRVSSMGRAARNTSGIKLRQPLGEAVVVADGDDILRLESLKSLVEEELNVKSVRFTSESGELMGLEVKPVFAILGKKHGRDVPRVAEAFRGLSMADALKLQNGEAVEVDLEGATVEVLPEEAEVVPVQVEGYSVVEEPGLLVGVSTEITSELEREGLARDVVRRIQALRKEADFEIDDTIETYYSGDPGVEEVFETEGEYIKAETLSVRLVKGDAPGGAHREEFDIDGKKLILGLRRV